MIRNVLSIAGSDPSGGAGIQADIKAISANGAYAMAALTAVTVQNTQGVSAVHLVPPDIVAAQIAAVFDDVRVDAVKIGMIANDEIACAVAAVLEGVDKTPIVLDPVMIAKGGAPLLADDAIAIVRDRLLPLAAVVTPNLPEAARLLDQPVATNRQQMEDQARALARLGARSVLIKGGHLDDPDSPDVFVSGDALHWLEGTRIATKNTHGTGCTLSSAVAAQLAQGVPDREAVSAAKAYISAAIARAEELTVGHGHGPVHHFSELWETRA
ncbi:bifunctional hydroxymethylpyrimidine kinase/phosphomethylpyrimidine kinase [Roseobacter sp. A03A-229]